VELVLYASVSAEVLEQVRTALRPIADLASLKVHRTIKGLSKSLQPPRNNVGVIVLLVAKREDITELIDASHLFQNVPIVVVVPDSDSQTIVLAHRLRPRYLTYIDTSFVGLCPVVKRLFERHDKWQTV
jgi:hypothetical protein